MPVSCHSCNSEEFVRQKTGQIDEAEKRFLKKAEGNVSYGLDSGENARIFFVFNIREMQLICIRNV